MSYAQRTHVCPYPACGQKYTRASTLKVHITSRHGSSNAESEKFRCRHCDSQFRRRQDRNVHEKRHTNPRPYSCQYCGLSFSRSYSVKYHQRNSCKSTSDSQTEPSTEARGSCERPIEPVNSQDVEETVEFSSFGIGIVRQRFGRGTSGLSARSWEVESDDEVLNEQNAAPTQVQSVRLPGVVPQGGLPDPTISETDSAVRDISAFQGLLDKGQYSPDWYKLAWSLAAKRGCYKVLFTLRTCRSFEVDMRDKQDRTALHLTAMYSHDCTTAAWLLKEGADVNATDRLGETTLYKALPENSTMTRLTSSLISLLIAHGANVDMVCGTTVPRTPIEWAAEFAHSTTLSLMIPRSQTLHETFNYGNLLHLVVKSCSTDITLVLIDLGVDVNARNDEGYTPLIMACRYGNSKQVETLLNSGRVDSLTDENGRSGLHHLLRRFPDPTANKVSIRYRASGILKLLIKNGTDVNAIDQWGDTALHSHLGYMTISGVVDVYVKKCIVEALLEYGAKLEATDGKGRTPTDIALEKMHIVADLVFKNWTSYDMLCLRSCVKILRIFKQHSAHRALGPTEHEWFDGLEELDESMEENESDD